jgi:hypothetical protein
VDLETRVTRRLGTRPFDPRASRSIEGVVQRIGKAWRAQIVVRTRPDDASPPRRELESTADDCESLGNAVVLAVALAIDPTAGFSDAAAEVPLPLPSAPVVAPKLPQRRPLKTPPETALAGRAALTLVGQHGLLPESSFGLGLAVATVLTKTFQLGLRARAFPEVEVNGDPSYAVGLASLTLELCSVARPGKRVELRACAGPALGVLHASVLVGDRTQPGQRALLAPELGLTAAFALNRALAFELDVRAAVPVTRYRFTLEGSNEALFAESVIAGIASVGLEMRLGVQP